MKSSLLLQILLVWSILAFATPGYVFHVSAATAPYVIGTSPTSAATGTPINTKLLVTFSTAMDPSTISTSTITLRHGTTSNSGTVSYTGVTATFATSANLLANTMYTATVTTGAKDTSGIALAVNYVWSFTTASIVDTTPPTVIGTYPVGSGAPLNSTISATFSKTMDPSTITATSFILNVNKTSLAVSGTVTYAGTTASFKPSTDLALNTNYTATITTAAKDLAGNALRSAFKWTFTTSQAIGACTQAPVALNSAASFAVLAGSVVSNTGSTTVAGGDVGVSPGSSITGFPPGIVTGGTIHLGNDVASQTAQADLLTAYNDAVARTQCVINVSGNIGGLTLTPGLYKSQSSLEISSGDLTLDAQGNANAVFIIQVSTTLTTTSGRQVFLAGGAQAKNVFWAVGSSATLGTTSVLYGTIMAGISISILTGATLNGRALAQVGAVTLDSSTITTIRKPTQDFSISANPNVLNPVFTNSSFVPVSIITLTSHNFTGTVQLTASVNPSGLAVRLDSPTLLLAKNGQNTTILAPNPSISTSPGSYQVTVIGTAGSLTQTTIITVVVVSVGDFRITANPASITIHKAPFYDPFAFASSSISLTSLKGFSGNILLSAVEATGSYGGLGLSFITSIVSLPPDATANSTLTVSAPNTTAGTYFVDVTATSFVNVTGTFALPIRHSVTITVHVVTPPPDFQIYLSVPFGGNVVFAGATTSVGVQVSSNGSGVFNGTVTLTGQVSPLVSHSPTLSFNPTQVSLTFPGTSFSQLTISTATLTPSGNYTIVITGTSGTLVHTAQLQLIVLPPPVLTLSPSSGPVGTRVTVHGSGFLNPSQGPYSYPIQLQMTFDDQLVGLFFVQGSSFNFTFNVPDAQAGIVHQVHAKELYPSNLDVQASFLVLPEPSALSVSVSAGTIYFPGDTATIFAMTSLTGQPTTVTGLQVFLVRPNGSNITLNAVLVTPGVYKTSYAVPTTGSIGTYAVIVRAQVGSANGSALASFEVKPTWLQSNGRNVITATSIVGAVGAIGVVGLAWRKGYFARRKDEFLIP